MKTTIDLPDELYRRVKSKAALEGLSIRELTISLYGRWLSGRGETADAGTQEEWLERWQGLGRRILDEDAPGPSAREVLEQDRDRLEPPGS